MKGYFWDVLISFCAQICFLALQGSMISSGVELQRNSNEKKLSPLPYLCLLVNCSIWSIYATMEGLIALFIPNALGVFAGFYCTMVYHQFSRIAIPIQYLAFSAALVLIALILGAAGSSSAVGFIAAVLSAIVYISPLATIQTVLRDKSTTSMPFYTSLLVFLSSFFWTIYGGYVAEDISVFVPSVIGLVFATIQMLLFAIYGFPRERYVAISSMY
jgi:uncharacterized protein with PQ loop repeat